MSLDYRQYYFGIQKQNKHVTNSLTTNNVVEEKDKRDVDLQVSKYLASSTTFLRFFNNILFGFYLILLVVLGYLLYIHSMPWKAKLILFTLLLLYPFYISSLQDNMRFLYNFLFSDSLYNNVVVAKENNQEVINDYQTILPVEDDRSVKYDNISRENSIIDTASINNRDVTFTNDRYSILTSVDSENVKYWNGICFYLFYVCVLGMIYELFATDAFPFSIYIKIGVVILLAAYPFYINTVANFLIYLFTLMYSLMMIQTYKDPSMKYNTTL
jgi:hypothetical protein